MKNMGSKDKKSLIDRIKSIKHIDIIIAILVLLVVLCLYFGLSSDKKPKVTITNDKNSEFVTKLESVVSKIDGVRNAKIVINYDDNKHQEIAMKEESVTHINKDGSTSVIESNREPIIIKDGKGDKPIVLKESDKSIKGVIVVAKGADDVRVKLDIIDAISTVLDINRDKIKVYEMQ